MTHIYNCWCASIGQRNLERQLVREIKVKLRTSSAADGECQKVSVGQSFGKEKTNIAI